ncbi:hypothetical protein [Mycobacterium gastri]|uniref:Uncharacterized protein n=1 Tax=Mycobacterium gastri TaxID=1777 RepID=A0A1X1VZ80_MYCGS|nr:hypothetical protein [Mycobacterium gastri]ETW26640.1 hypothetical protein MGAST_07700 [Mycobacterium gastri 'Wayne']ORV75561.1 hypothetical protein AWC07_23025 [Mycobacterium gastri]
MGMFGIGLMLGMFGIGLMLVEGIELMPGMFGIGLMLVEGIELMPGMFFMLSFMFFMWFSMSCFICLMSASIEAQPWVRALYQLGGAKSSHSPAVMMKIPAAMPVMAKVR